MLQSNDENISWCFADERHEHLTSMGSVLSSPYLKIPSKCSSVNMWLFKYIPSRVSVKTDKHFHMCCDKQECPWHCVARWVASVRSKSNIQFPWCSEEGGSYRFLSRQKLCCYYKNTKVLPINSTLPNELSSQWQASIFGKKPVWPGGGGGYTGNFLRAAQLFHDVVTLTLFHDVVTRGGGGVTQVSFSGQLNFPWHCDDPHSRHGNWGVHRQTDRRTLITSVALARQNTDCK